MCCVKKEEKKGKEGKNGCGKKKAGIVGLGRFGKLLATVLRTHFDVTAYDKTDRRAEAERIGVTFSDEFSGIENEDIVVLSVPISALEATLGEVSGKIKAGALVLDVCSVKVGPVGVLQKMLPHGVDIMGTHPLFGPDTTSVYDPATEGVAYNVRGKKIALCPVRMDAHDVNDVREFLEGLGLIVCVTTPEEHDRQMATAQCVTHYIAMGLMKAGVSSQALTTPNFDALLKIVDRLRNDTDTLMRDIQNENPFGADARAAFRAGLDEVDSLLAGGFR